jgi:hypothetical protein
LQLVMRCKGNCQKNTFFNQWMSGKEVSKIWHKMLEVIMSNHMKI